MKVVHTESPATKDRDISIERSCCPPDTEFFAAVYDNESDNNEQFYKDIADADIILNWYVYFGKKEIDALEHCKVISFQSTGYNEIDIDYATEKGVCVVSILDYCTQETAENAFALMLALQRSLKIYEKSVQVDKKWDLYAASHMRRVEGQVMGIIGLGRIGQSVASKAIGFGMPVIAYDPYLPPQIAEALGVKLVDLETIWAESDVISVHMNLTAENVHFLNKETFKKCKKRPIIINEGRGPMISEEDLVWALDNDIVRGAGLDMLESEFPDLDKCKLMGRPNVILTPHSGYFSDTSDYLMSKLSMDNALLCYQGRHKEAKIVRNGIGL
ncbi:MAG: C-terminal binding protein [Oscillospiraceae bacterium]